MNNLIISYDLNSPGQSYTRVTDAIKTLGTWGLRELLRVVCEVQARRQRGGGNCPAGSGRQ